MKITKRQLDDKLQLLKLAGFDTDSGWDYDIPQTWANQLNIMGLHLPMVADCREIGTKLHCSLEAYPIILDHRSKANEEIFIAMYEAESTVSKFIVNDEYIYAEAYAGFLDLNLIIRAFEAGRNSK